MCSSSDPDNDEEKTSAAPVQTGSRLARLALSVRDFVSAPFVLADVRSWQRLRWYLG